MQPAHVPALQWDDMVNVMGDAGRAREELGMDIEPLDRFEIGPRWRRPEFLGLPSSSVRGNASTILFRVRDALPFQSVGICFLPPFARCG